MVVFPWLSPILEYDDARPRRPYVWKEETMKKTWKKPAMCTVAVGMEMSRYFPAQLPSKK